MTASALLGLIVVLLTEALSQLHAITRPTVTACWVAIIAAAVVTIRRTKPFDGLEPLLPALRRAWTDSGMIERTLAAGCAVILAITLSLALYAPPSAPDALAYHLSRVEHWVQDGTLEPYPTHDERQLWLGPGAEFFVLQLRLLTGTGRFSNLVQWLAFAGTSVVVTLIARELGGRRRGQLLAALFVITAPMAIAEAAGSQVDLVSSFYVAVSVALMLRIRRSGIRCTSGVTITALGAAGGVAWLTKGTSPLFLAPFAVWIACAAVRESVAKALTLAAVALAISVAVSVPHSFRNASVYGQPLGPSDSDELLNEVVSPASFASNVIRNAAIHAGSRSLAWNRFVYDGVAAAHRTLGIGVSDPRTTRRSSFVVPRGREDELLATNPLHLVLIIVSLAIAVRRRLRETAMYLLCVMAGAFLFALLVRWQPWHSRQHLPLFVVAAGAVGPALEGLRKRATTLVAAVLVVLSGPAVFRNPIRPVISANSVFTGTYESHMFLLHRTQQEYNSVVQDLVSRGCPRVGLLNSKGAAEYPLWFLLRRHFTETLELRHVNVVNVTRAAATARDRQFKPCAIVSITRRRGKEFSPPPGFRQGLMGHEVRLFLPQF